MKMTTTVLLAILILTSSNAQKRIKGNGNVVTIERTTNDYDGISVGGFYHVELVDGNEGKITLTGEDNILDYIETEVKGGILVIKAKNNKNLIPSRGEGVFITIPFESINSVKGSGSGKIIGKKTIETNSFKVGTSGSRHVELNVKSSSVSVSTSGSSKIQISGTADKLEVKSSGSSNVGTYELEVDKATLTLSGSSDARIAVEESINARISGSGHVRYRGNPQKINTKTSGSGKITKETAEF